MIFVIRMIWHRKGLQTINRLSLFGVRDHLGVKYNLLRGHSRQRIFDDATLPS